MFFSHNHYEDIWLRNCSLKCKPSYYKRDTVKRGYFDQNYLISLLTPTYFAVALSRFELKPTQILSVNA